MKLFIPFAAAFIILLAVENCRAQAPVQFNLKTPPKNIAVDGDLKEWGDSLTVYSPEERISYNIANSKDTLYLAVKIYDKTEIARILLAGLTFSIDPRGKKKETFSITYPLNVQGSTGTFNRKAPDNEDNISQEDRDELLRERLTTLRGIRAVGFKDVEDEMITTSNTYGIQAAINYDAVGNLVYEEAIPLSFFHAADDAKTGWAFNIKINGLKMPAEGEGAGEGGGGFGGGGNHRGGGGGGGRGGGGHRGGGNSGSAAGRGEMFKSVDFWGKFFLAK